MVCFERIFENQKVCVLLLNGVFESSIDLIKISKLRVFLYNWNVIGFVLILVLN